ncbi:MAG: rhomboid family intramembrane serine protease [Deltaproteobacteria bacterium]|nr:rhomboid family intramembrane serine protease [Deltaproteobacteria bacterium]
MWFRPRAWPSRSSAARRCGASTQRRPRPGRAPRARATRIDRRRPARGRRVAPPRASPPGAPSARCRPPKSPRSSSRCPRRTRSPRSRPPRSSSRSTSASERSGRLVDFIDRGENRAALRATGEPHRCLTALTLHADLAHAAGNARSSAPSSSPPSPAASASASRSPDFVATGTVGNLADALSTAPQPAPVGASTGVFGLIGVLTGLAAWRPISAARAGGAWSPSVGARAGRDAQRRRAGRKLSPLAAHLLASGVHRGHRPRLSPGPAAATEDGGPARRAFR